MAKKIQAWSAFGPKIVHGLPMTKDELIENIIQTTNQSKGSVLAVLSELDVQLEAGLRAGRIVQLPNGTHFEPIGKKDGTVNINVRVSPELDKRVNAGFRGKWLNAENIGKSEAEMVALWNEAHPEDPIPTEG
jgi:nucleoid DNA-binding protein